MGNKERLKELVTLIDQFFDGEKDQIRKWYRIPTSMGDIGAMKNARIVGDAAKIAQSVMMGGGSTEEVRAALKYLMVCMDAKEYRLDYLQCATECDIPYLKLKYNNVKID